MDIGTSARQDLERRQHELRRAIRDVLGPRMALMLHFVAGAARMPAPMPQNEAVLHWLKENMPRTAARVQRKLENKT